MCCMSLACGRKLQTQRGHANFTPTQRPFNCFFFFKERKKQNNSIVSFVYFQHFCTHSAKTSEEYKNEVKTLEDMEEMSHVSISDYLLSKDLVPKSLLLLFYSSKWEIPAGPRDRKPEEWKWSPDMMIRSFIPSAEAPGYSEHPVTIAGHIYSPTRPKCVQVIRVPRFALFFKEEPLFVWSLNDLAISRGVDCSNK